jgi:hypothetical protein
VDVATQEQLSGPAGDQAREPFIDGVTRACIDEKIEDGFAQVICALFELAG